MDTTLIGIPLDLGAENLGVDSGPEAFRHNGIVGKLTKAGLAITDSGNVVIADRKDLQAGNPHARYQDEIVRVSEETAALTKQAIQKSHKVIALGGDHSINLGVVSGASVALGGNLGLIYFDAHGDMNTEETTLSGNIHGMHLASLLGFGGDALKNVGGPAPKVKKEHLLHIGGCDLDQAEIDLISRENLKAYTLFDILTTGLSPLLQQIDELAARVDNIWVSVDLDVIDRMYAPGAGMPNPSGLTYREIATITEYIGKHTNVIGVDVVEYNPLQDKKAKTAELGIELIAKLFGKNYSWYTNYMERNKV
ncbi:MAG TPA: arginase [Verrucomicrobiae bacterium]|nr:arginase [Verrucomicrobiae bacterium]